MPAIALYTGDLTTHRADALVNAANSGLLGGGGVDGAIHRRGGPAILAECKALRANRYRDGLPPGEAVATTAGKLLARWVIHTVGPVYAPGEDRSPTLVACHRNVLRVAAEIGAHSVLFPAVSTGVYGWPVESAAEIALGTVAAAGFDGTVGFVLFDAAVTATFAAVAERLGVAVSRESHGAGGGR